MNAYLEGQIVSSALTGRLLDGREGGFGCCCRLLWRERSTGCRSTASNSCGGGYTLGHLSANDVVGTDVIIPSSVKFAGINVKLYCDFLSRLDIELLDSFFAKDVEHHLTGEVTWHFNDVFLYHPRISCTL